MVRDISSQIPFRAPAFAQSKESLAQKGSDNSSPSGKAIQGAGAAHGQEGNTVEVPRAMSVSQRINNINLNNTSVSVGVHRPSGPTQNIYNHGSAGITRDSSFADFGSDKLSTTSKPASTTQAPHIRDANITNSGNATPNNSYSISNGNGTVRSSNGTQVEDYQARYSDSKPPSAPSATDAETHQVDRVLQRVQLQLSSNRKAAANFINNTLGGDVLPVDEILSSDTPDNEMQQHLKDGVIVTDLIIKLFPDLGTKKAKKSPSPWVHKENITAFLVACEKAGVSAESRFESSDLVDGRNLKQVYITLNTLERLVNPGGSNTTSPAASRKASVAARTNERPTITHASTSTIYPTVGATPQQESVVQPVTIATTTEEISTALPPVISRKSSSRRLSTTASDSQAAQQQVLENNESSISLIGKTASNVTIFSGSSARLHSSDSSKTINEDALGNLQPSSGSIGPSTLGATRKNSVNNSRSSRNSVSGSSTGLSSLPGTTTPITRRTTRRNKEIINLGRYQLANCIGKGQFGSVYQAFDTETGNVVAIKRIPLTKKNKDAVDELMSEVQLLKSLTHPNIVKYLGLTKEEECLDIVLEYMECGSLLSIMKKYDITINETLASAYVRDILNGLAYLHSRGVVHCDLKCANILTTKDSLVKITDFGVSRQLNYHTTSEQSGTEKTIMANSDSNAESIAGTPYWMAPEVIRLEGACTASDIWSLGCTVIEMITGKPPYSDMKNPMAVLFRIVEDDEPPIPDRDLISDELHDFLQRCFKQNVDERASAQQLLSHHWLDMRHEGHHGDGSDVSLAKSIASLGERLKESGL